MLKEVPKVTKMPGVLRVIITIILFFLNFKYLPAGRLAPNFSSLQTSFKL